MRGYPTIKFFRNGKVVEYNGGRTADELIKWLKKKTGPPAVTLASAEDATKLKEKSPVVVVGYFSNAESAEAKAFLDVATDNDELPFGIVSDSSVASGLEISKEGVVLFKKFDEGRNDFDGELQAEALKRFISTNQLPLVIEFTQEVSFHHPVG